MIRMVFFLLAWLPAVALAQMVTRDGVALTPQQEARAEVIGEELRCLVCQNESIEDSSATLAKQLRVIIREQVIAGASPEEIKRYMVQRYGIFVLLKPPLSPLTLLLYASPALALAIGFFVAWMGRRNRISVPPLEPAEAARVSVLREP